MKKKGMLISIIVLLAIFLFFGATGFYFKLTTKENKKREETLEEDKNINQEFHFDGKLYFYDQEELLGTYACQSDNCSYASETIDDANYSLEYYDDNSIDMMKMIQKHYAFIIDGSEEIILYDILEEKVITQYKAVKNYTVGIENDLFIVQTADDKWGIITLNESFKTLIPTSYDYIGVLNNTTKENKELYADNFVVLNNNKWKIIDINNIALSSELNYPIVSYNGLAIKTKNEENFIAYDYSGEIIKGSYRYQIINFLGKYVEMVTTNNRVFVYDPEKRDIVSEIVYLRRTDFTGNTIFPPYETQINDNILEIKVYTNQEYGNHLTYTYNLGE